MPQDDERRRGSSEGSIERTAPQVKPHATAIPAAYAQNDRPVASIMFTGLIQTVGEVISAQPIPPGAPDPPGSQGLMRLIVHPGDWRYRPNPGDSIAVNGCCLTVADHIGPNRQIAFNIVPQTLKLTTLGSLSPGSKVNLEHAARLDSLMGGHLVQGHIDGLGYVVSVENTLQSDLESEKAGRSAAEGGKRDDQRDSKRGGERGGEGGGEGGGEYRIRIAPAPGLMEYAVPKGSVTVMGVSLTLANVDLKGGPDAIGEFEVALIPTTLQETTLGELVVGDAVNLEMDATVKTVVHWLKNFGQGR